MRYVEAPETFHDSSDKLRSIFLAGGITGCPDWQSQLAGMLSSTDLVVMNPRRANFPIHDPNAAEHQIMWEHQHLREASMISFWFCAETLCPIVLYELGAWSMTEKKLFVGVDPKYKRRADVEIQTRLTRPDINIVYQVEDLAEQIRNYGR